MPFLTSRRLTLFRANDADWPADTAGTLIRLRSIDRIAVWVNWPRESGPIRMLSPSRAVPARTIPDTTVPVKGTEKVSLIWNSNGASALYRPW